MGAVEGEKSNIFWIRFNLIFSYVTNFKKFILFNSELKKRSPLKKTRWRQISFWPNREVIWCRNYQITWRFINNELGLLFPQFYVENIDELKNIKTSNCPINFINRCINNLKTDRRIDNSEKCKKFIQFPYILWLS